MKSLARTGLVLGLLYLLVVGLGLATGIVPFPLRDIVLEEARIVGDAGLPAESRDAPPAGRPCLLVTLSSRQNLIAKASRSELNIYAIVADCSDRDLTFFAHGPFDRGLHVSHLMLDADQPRAFSCRSRAACDRQANSPADARL